MAKLTVDEIVALAHKGRLPVEGKETRLTQYVTLSGGQRLILELDNHRNEDLGPSIKSALLVDGEDEYELSRSQIEKLSWQFVDGVYDWNTSWLENHWFENELRQGLFNFATAPQPAQQAIMMRLGEYGALPEAEPGSDDTVKAKLARDIELALEDVGVAFVELPATQVSATVVGSPAFRQESSPKIGETWEAYHAWYIRGGVPAYSSENRWPVLAAGDLEDEVFEDGWHRLHSYFRSGYDTIPVVAFDRRAAQDALDRLRRNLAWKQSSGS